MDRALTWIPRGLATLVFCVYAWAAPAGFYWLDSAGLSAEAIGLGSPPPTGFPLYCLLGKLAQLLPLGEMAFRVQLLSALSAALAVLWITRLTYELAREDTAGLVGATVAGALLAVATIFARQATVAEVYAPNAALLAGALWLYTRVARGGDGRYGLALAVVCGLGLGVHVTFLLVGAPAFALLMVRLYRGARWPLSAPLLTVLVCLALYTYLPLRSASGHAEALDWGHPRTAHALWEHASAAGFRDVYADQMGSSGPDGALAGLGAVLETAADSTGPLALLAGFFGFIWLYRQRRSRWAALALSTLLVGDIAYSLWIDPTGAPDWQNLVPLSLALCIASGVGVAWLARFLGRAGPYAGAVVGLVLVTTPALSTVPTIWAASTGDIPRVMAETGLAAAPPRAVVLLSSDSLAAAMRYLTTVEGVRPDVAVFTRSRLDDNARVRALMPRTGVLADDLGDRDAFTWLLEHAPAISWELGRDAPPPGTALVAGAPLARLVRDGDEERRARAAATTESTAASDIHRAVQTLEGIFERSGRNDRIALRVHADALTALGRLALARRDLELAALLMAAAIEVRPDEVSAWALAAIVSWQRGDEGHAREWLQRARNIDPAHPDVRRAEELLAERASHTPGAAVDPDGTRAPPR